VANARASIRFITITPELVDASLPSAVPLHFLGIMLVDTASGWLHCNLQKLAAYVATCGDL